jgi:hypothetical protein
MRKLIARSNPSRSRPFLSRDGRTEVIPVTTALIVSEEELAAWAIREAVDYGNIAPLFERVHSGKALPEECALAAEFHNGTRKRPPHAGRRFCKAPTRSGNGCRCLQ